MRKRSLKTITALSHEVGAILRAESTATRLQSMDLCADILAVCDRQRDDLMRATLRSWIVKVQTKFQGEQS